MEAVAREHAADGATDRGIVIHDDNVGLDVFVADRITTSAKMTIGSANYPVLTRVYLGGVGTTLTITNDVDLGGFLYLARGKLEASNPLEFFGGIIAGELE